MESIAQPSKPKDKHLKAVLFGSFGLGMAVAVGVYLAWRLHAVPPGLYGLFTAAALLVCPPFILSFAVGPTPDSDLAFVLVVGTIVFANAFLYAGVAAGGYFVVTTVGKRKGR